MSEPAVKLLPYELHDDPKFLREALAFEIFDPVDGWHRTDTGDVWYSWPDLPNPIDRPEDPHSWPEEKAFIKLFRHGAWGWSWDIIDSTSKRVAGGTQRVAAMAARDALDEFRIRFEEDAILAESMMFARKSARGGEST